MRDSRKDPQAGDILKEGALRYSVKANDGKKVRYELTRSDRTEPIYRIPMTCVDSLKQWRNRRLEVVSLASPL